MRRGIAQNGVKDVACGTITVKKWGDFQHYKHRSPPWIRFHRSLLAQPWWRNISDGAGRFLVELWLLASENHGVVQYDTMMIAYKLKRPSPDAAKMRGWLQELVSAGAITLAGVDASGPAIALSSTDAA